MLLKLRTVIYHVSDLTAAKQWYANVTGVQPYFDEAFYVGFELGLDPSPENFTGGNHSVSYWAVEDIKASVEKFVAAGAILVQDITNVGGPIHVAVVADPFGNNIGLITGA